MRSALPFWGRKDRPSIPFSPRAVAQDLVGLLEDARNLSNVVREIGNPRAEDAGRLERAPEVQEGPPYLVPRRVGRDPKHREVIAFVDDLESPANAGADGIFVQG